MKTLLSILLTLTAVSSITAADLKIASVDMKRAFNEYQKGQDQAAVVKKKAAKFVDERKEKYESYQSLGAEAGKLQKKANDSVLSQAQRAEAGAQFEAKVKALRELEGEIKAFEQKRTDELREEESKVRNSILEDMTTVINKMGKDRSFNLVLDRSGASLGGLPVALYVDGITDLTDDLIKELNKDAPAPAPKEEEKKPASKKK